MNQQKMLNLYVYKKGYAPRNSGYRLDKETGLFIKSNGAKSLAFTETTFNAKTGEAIRHRLYMSNKVFISKPQLNYVINHEMGHMVLNNNYGMGIDDIIKRNHALLNTEAHISIQYSGRNFIKLNGWSFKNIEGVYKGSFSSIRYTPEPIYINKLKPLLIKIK